MELSADFSALQQQVFQKFKIEFIVEIPQRMWEERILPILNELETRGSVTKSVEEGTTFHLCNNLEDLSALRRLKDYPDETDARELLEPWAGVCTEEKSAVVVNPISCHSGASRNPV